MNFSRSIREQDPLKQGLKRHLLFFRLTGMGYSRARSIKTRIETYVDPSSLGGNTPFESKIH